MENECRSCVYVFDFWAASRAAQRLLGEDEELLDGETSVEIYIRDNSTIISKLHDESFVTITHRLLWLSRPRATLHAPQVPLELLTRPHALILVLKPCSYRPCVLLGVLPKCQWDMGSHVPSMKTRPPTVELHTSFGVLRVTKSTREGAS